MSLGIKDALDKEMMAWWEKDIQPKIMSRGTPPPQNVRVEVSTVSFTKVEKIPEKPKEVVLNGGTNSNTNENNANV